GAAVSAHPCRRDGRQGRARHVPHRSRAGLAGGSARPLATGRHPDACVQRRWQQHRAERPALARRTRGQAAWGRPRRRPRWRKLRLHGLRAGAPARRDARHDLERHSCRKHQSSRLPAHAERDVEAAQPGNDARRCRGQGYRRAGQDHRARAWSRHVAGRGARGRRDLRSPGRSGRVRRHAKQQAERNKEALSGVDRESGAAIRAAAAPVPFHVLRLVVGRGWRTLTPARSGSTLLHGEGEVRKIAAVALLVILIVATFAAPALAWSRGGGHGGFHGRGVVVIGTGCCWGWGWGPWWSYPPYYAP